MCLAVGINIDVGDDTFALLKWKLEGGVVV